MTSAVSAWRSYYWASVFLWYSYKDNGTDSRSVEDFYGLYRADGTAKPAYGKYRELLEANK